jgi:hypothetical protein
LQRKINDLKTAETQSKQRKELKRYNSFIIEISLKATVEKHLNVVIEAATVSH